MTELKYPEYVAWQLLVLVQMQSWSQSVPLRVLL